MALNRLGSGRHRLSLSQRRRDAARSTQLHGLEQKKGMTTIGKTLLRHLWIMRETHLGRMRVGRTLARRRSTIPSALLLLSRLNTLKPALNTRCSVSQAGTFWRTRLISHGIDRVLSRCLSCTEQAQSSRFPVRARRTSSRTLNRQYTCLTALMVVGRARALWGSMQAWEGVMMRHSQHKVRQ